MADLYCILAKNESIVMIGDFNRHIGNDKLGVYNNDPRISSGGQLIRDLISSGRFVLVNNLEITKGGPFTRFDPGDVSKKSCLDLVIVSVNLVQFVKELIIDSENIYQISRVTNVNGNLKLTPTDHHTLILTFQNLPTKVLDKPITKEVRWNYNKEGGWETYKEITEDKCNDLLNMFQVKLQANIFAAHD